MKISLLLFLTALTTFSVASAQEATDTVKVIDNVNSVTVSKTGDTTTIDAIYDDIYSNTKRHYKYEVEIEKDNNISISDFPSDWGMTLPFLNKEPQNSSNSKKQIKRYFVGFNHIFWGWKFNYAGNANIKECFEIGIRNLLGLAWKRRNSEFEIGLGISESRYLCGEGMIFVKEGDKLGVAGVEDGIKVKHSRLNVYTFHIPLIYTQKISKYFSTSIGATINLNTYAKAWNEFENGSLTVKNECKGLHQNLFSVEPYASIQFDWIGVYAAWKPMKLFDNKFGPELKSWSLGVELIL